MESFHICMVAMEMGGWRRGGRAPRFPAPHLRGLAPDGRRGCCGVLGAGVEGWGCCGCGQHRGSRRSPGVGNSPSRGLKNTRPALSPPQVTAPRATAGTAGAGGRGEASRGRTCVRRSVAWQPAGRVSRRVRKAERYGSQLNPRLKRGTSEFAGPANGHPRVLTRPVEDLAKSIVPVRYGAGSGGHWKINVWGGLGCGENRG